MKSFIPKKYWVVFVFAAFFAFFGLNSMVYADNNTPSQTPSGVTATQIPGTFNVRIQWNDNSNDESGFNLSRQNAPYDFWGLTRVGENITSYTDTSPSLGYWQEVCYTVSSINSINNTVSDPSSKGCVTMVKPPKKEVSVVNPPTPLAEPSPITPPVTPAPVIATPAPVSGCMDSSATNYDRNATVSGIACVYSAVIPTAVPKEETVPATSQNNTPIPTNIHTEIVTLPFSPTQNNNIPVSSNGNIDTQKNCNLKVLPSLRPAPSGAWGGKGSADANLSMRNDSGWQSATKIGRPREGDFGYWVFNNVPIKTGNNQYVFSISKEGCRSVVQSFDFYVPGTVDRLIDEIPNAPKRTVEATGRVLTGNPENPAEAVSVGALLFIPVEKVFVPVFKFLGLSKVGDFIGGKLFQYFPKAFEYGKTAPVAIKTVQYSAKFTEWVNKGEKNVSVYIGYKDGKAVYVGISNDVARREAEHVMAGKLDKVRPIVGSLTRNQARTIEENMIIKNKEFKNSIDSIAGERDIYQEALKYGDDLMEQYGIKATGY